MFVLPKPVKEIDTVLFASSIWWPLLVEVPLYMVVELLFDLINVVFSSRLVELSVPFAAEPIWMGSFDVEMLLSWSDAG